MLEEVLRWIGFGLCHQLPERSFFGGGIQLPVCARDTGIYLGFLCALFVLWALDRGRRASELSSAWMTFVLIGFIATMVVDGFTSYIGMRESTNDLRLITGLLAGFAIAAFVVPLFNSQVWRVPGRDRVLGKPAEALVFLLAVPISFLVLRVWGPGLGVVYPLVTGFSILVTFGVVNAVVVALFPWFERRADRFRDAWPVFTVAMILTLLELWWAVAAKTWLLSFAQVAR